MDTCEQEPVVVTVILGEDREFFFGIKDNDEDVYINLTGVTEIVLSVPAALGGSTDFKLSLAEITITDASKGKFKVVASAAKTALFKLGKLSIETVITFTGGKLRIAQIEHAFIVKKRLF